MAFVLYTQDSVAATLDVVAVISPTVHQLDVNGMAAKTLEKPKLEMSCVFA